MFGDFPKAVKRVSREIAHVAQAVAPVHKAGSVAIASVVPGAQVFAPFLALVPQDTLLATNYTIGGPWLMMIPEYREGVQREVKEIDYAKIGELAALAYLKGR